MVGDTLCYLLEQALSEIEAVKTVPHLPNSISNFHNCQNLSGGTVESAYYYSVVGSSGIINQIKKKKNEKSM